MDTTYRLVCLALLVSVTACADPDEGSDSGSASELGPQDTDLVKGTYEVTSWTRSEESCDGEGEDVLDKRSTHVLIREQKTLAGILEVGVEGPESILVMVECDGVPDCEEKAENENTIHVGWGFDVGDVDDGWTGASVGMVGIGDDCRIAITSRMLTATVDAIRVEARVTSFEQAGDCPDHGDVDTAASVEEEPCATREVVQAIFVR